MSIAFVQTASNTASASTVTVTLGSATTAGNCLVACIALGSGSSLATISSITLGGSAGNWAQLKAVGDLTTGAEQLASWADPSCAGGQTSVVINCTGASVLLAQVFEFSGIAASSVLDQFATFDSGGGSNSTFSVTTPATTQASELAIGCVYGFNTTITGPSSPWVNETTVVSTTRTLQAGYDILSSTGTVTYSGSFGASALNGQILVTLFAAASAAVPLAAQLTPPGRQSPMRLAGPVYIPAVSPPATPIQQPAYSPPPRPPGLLSPATLAQPIRPSRAAAVTAAAAPLQGPYLPPRRKPGRAVVQFTPVTTTNKPVGVVQPLATVPVRRRVLQQRAVIAHVYGSAFVAVPAPLQGPYLPPRRVPARTVWHGSAPFLGFVQVPVPLQGPYLPPRRKPGRAVVQFTPVTTSNAAPTAPPAGTVPVLMANPVTTVIRRTGRVSRF